MSAIGGFRAVDALTILSLPVVALAKALRAAAIAMCAGNSVLNEWFSLKQAENWVGQLFEQSLMQGY